MPYRPVTQARPIIQTRRANLLDYAARWGALVYAPLTEASGNRSELLSGLTLTDTNTVTGGAAIAANIGASSQFTAANSERLTRADNATMSIAADQDWWFWIWVLADSFGADRYIVHKGSGISATTLEYSLQYQNSNQRFVGSMGDGSNTGVVNATANALGAPATATPYGILVTHDSVNNLLGIRVNNGTKNTAATSGRQPADTAGGFNLSSRTGTANFWDGRMSGYVFGKAPPLGIAAVEDEISATLNNAGAGLAFPWT